GRQGDPGLLEADNRPTRHVQRLEETGQDLADAEPDAGSFTSGRRGPVRTRTSYSFRCAPSGCTLKSLMRPIERSRSATNASSGLVRCFGFQLKVRPAEARMASTARSPLIPTWSGLSPDHRYRRLGYSRSGPTWNTPLSSRSSSSTRSGRNDVFR